MKKGLRINLLDKSQVVRGEDGIPTDIMLFKAGANPTLKGTFVYDPASKEALTKWQLDQDTRDQLPFDLAHLSLSEVGTVDAHKAYGWFSVSYEDDGIWARNCEWTPQGRALLENREFRFFSPTFLADEDGLIAGLINCALTNEPASLEINPLVASKNTQGTDMTIKNETELAQDEESTDIEVTLADDVESADGEEAPMPEMTPDEMKEAMAALQSQVAELQAQLTAKDEEIAALNEKLAGYESENTDELVNELVSEGHLAPNMKAWAKSLSTDQLKAFAKLNRSGKPRIASLKGEIKSRQASGFHKDLSPAALSIFKQMGVDPSKVRKA